MKIIAFEQNQLSLRSVDRITQAVDRGAHAVVTGLPGTGRTTAVNVATRNKTALRLAYGNAPARTVYGLRQAAATVPGGARLLEVYRSDGLDAAVRHLDELTGHQLVVVDDADRLLQAASDASWTDAVPGMTAPSDLVWADWLAHRTGPTLLVGRRGSSAPMDEIEHVLDGGSWPLKVRHAEKGFIDWPTLAHKLTGRLDWFWLAAAAAPLMQAGSFNRLVQEERRDDILRELARVFRAGGGHRVEALDLIHTLGDASEAVVRMALHVGLPRSERDPTQWLESRDRLFADLRKAHLVQISGADNGADGVVRPSAALVEWGAVQPLSPRRCGSIARALLRTVNNPRALQPECAALVLTAHDLAVRAGQEDLALETATLHVHGLVQLARSLSKDDQDASAAWHLYDRLEPLVSAERVARDPSLRRTRSYVLNYRAFNGRRAGYTDEAHALVDVDEATRLWPENARWHGQRIRLLFTLGRVTDALKGVEQAESSVEEHPQRARHLRVVPAQECLGLGLVQTALQLLQLTSPPWGSDAEALGMVRRMLDKLSHGVPVTELTSDATRLLFRGRHTLRLDRRRSGLEPWSASIEQLEVHRSGKEPLQTLDTLTRELASEVAGLVRRPTPWLSDEEARRKGELLAAIDVLNSDIGLSHATERWFVGRVEGRALVPMDSRVAGTIDIVEGVRPAGAAEPPGLWFGRATVDRAGLPTGPVTDLRPAGAGRSLDELRQELIKLWGEVG